MTVTATSSSGAEVTYTAPTATDAMDPNPIVTSLPASGSTFPIGTTTVVCTATDASGNKASSAFTVTVNAMAAPTLAEALNAPTWTWRTGGKTVWAAQTASSRDGYASGKSGVIPSKQSSWIETSITGPGVLKFWWKVSSEANKDFLRLYVGNVEQARISGEVDWIEVSINIPAGAQQVRWSYTKDGSDVAGASGLDTSWVDLISFSTTLAASPASAESSAFRLLSTAASAEVAPEFVTELNHVEENSVRVTVLGTPGEVCQLQASEDLSDWIIIGTGAVGSEGTIDFVDPEATATAPRFYRAQGIGAASTASNQ